MKTESPLGQGGLQGGFLERRPNPPRRSVRSGEGSHLKPSSPPRGDFQREGDPSQSKPERLDSRFAGMT